MRYISHFESFGNENKILIVVDVQKSFKKFFTDKYVSELKKYCKRFDKVYQIFDNHHEGKSVNKDYLYNHKAEINDLSDLYEFPNQVEIIEKRYNYDVDVDFYKKILDDETYNKLKSREKKLSKGEFFKTKEDTIIVFIGNNHKWFHVPKKLYKVFKDLKEAQTENAKITIVGGANGECLDDVITTAVSLGLQIDKNSNFIYSAEYCPI